MPSSHCRKSGHNIRTCPELQASKASPPGSRGGSARGACHCSICNSTTHNKRYHVSAPATPSRTAQDRPPPSLSSDRRCRICRQPGHDQRTCTYENKEEVESGPGIRHCSVCKATDHDIRKCPEAKERGRTAGVRHCSECNATDHDICTCTKAKERGRTAGVRHCSGCNATDHDIRKCPEAKGRGRAAGVRHCSVCKETDHDVRKCPVAIAALTSGGEDVKCQRAEGRGRTKGVRHCSVCRDTTHDRRTCPKLKGKSAAAEADGYGSCEEEESDESEEEDVTDEEDGDDVQVKCGRDFGQCNANSDGGRSKGKWNVTTEDSIDSWTTADTSSSRPQSARGVAARTASDLAEEFKGVIPGTELRITDRVLGRGGFGEVLLGHIRGTAVAVKKLRVQNMTSRQRETFRKEGATLAGLCHPGIVQLIGVCVEPELALVMEHMANGSLYNLIHKTGKRMEAGEKLQIARDVASGLSYLHSQKMIHRDIKSSNVLLDNDLRAKICDVGHARTRNHSASTLTAHVGTILYMAPEIMRGEPYSEKADVYSFALLLYEILIESQPFEDVMERDGMGIPQLQVMIKDRGLRPSFDEGSRKLSSQAKAWVSKCWHDNPARRPSMADISRELNAFPSTAIYN